jgi:hypothetical protein
MTTKGPNGIFPLPAEALPLSFAYYLLLGLGASFGVLLMPSGKTEPKEPRVDDLVKSLK